MTHTLLLQSAKGTEEITIEGLGLATSFDRGTGS